MLDWQISEEEQPLANLRQEGRPMRRMRRWRLWVGLLLVLVVAGLLLFRWRLSERTEAMEADLKAFIRHEEQQRAFGLAKQADQLMVSNAPTEWQQAYRLSFADPDDVQQVSLEIEEIELNGSEAYVTVRLDNARRKRRVAQVRFYRLVGQEWRRAPLFAAFWGQEKQIELADEDITIVYPAREEAFAQRLAADLPALLQQWPSKQKQQGGLTPFTIKIEPTEFAPALLYVEQYDSTQQITLNSPQLIMPEHANIDGEGAIRLALANALLEEVDLSNYAQKSLLPSGATFLGALRNTFVLRWALPDEAIPRQIWHDKMADLSPGPFLGQWKINRGKMPLERVWEPHLSEAMSLLIANYLYDQYGSQTLKTIASQLPSAQSWDRIFYPLTSRYTIELEEEALWANSTTKTVVSPPPQLPLPVTVINVDARTGQLEVQIADQERTLSIETADSTLIDAEKRRLTAECAILHKELIITEGDWLEMGQALQARQLIVNDPQPAILPEEAALASPDTLAYLVELRNTPGRGFDAFLALSEDGTVTPLSTLPPQITPGWQMRSSIPWPARFLLTVSVPNCSFMWLLMYDPQQGVVDQPKNTLPM